MPYESIDELPDQVKDIPKHAKEIFLASFNSAYETTCKDRGDEREQCAFRIGWAAIGSKYEKDKDGNWVEKKENETPETQSTCPQKEIILSSIPVFKDNDLIIPFVRDGTKAFGKDGKEYTITSEALDRDFKSYENGHITANHKQLETGRISEVWRQKPFVYGRITGLTDELRELILSKAYKGVSQESTAVSVTESGDVTSLKGLGTTLVFYPEIPACSPLQGCGIPISSTIKEEPVFSLNTQDKILDNNDLKTHGGLKSQMTEEEPGANALKSTVITELMALKETNIALTQENEHLKSTIKTRDDQITKFNDTLTSTIKDTIEKHDRDMKEKAEMDAVITELTSVIKVPETRDSFLKTNPSLETIKSTIAAFKELAPRPDGKVGATAGQVIESTVTDYDYDKVRTEFYNTIGRS